MNKPLIGIIGGTGLMGNWFKKFFNRQGYEVLVAGRKTALSPIELAKKCDVIIVSVPIDKTVPVINQIARHVRKGALLMDLTSVKTAPVKSMLASKAEVIGAHPVFGPSSKSIKNQTIVLCPARTKKWLPWLIKILKKNKAKIKISTPEKHDKMMAIVQGITHFTSLNIVNTMKKSGFSIKEILEYTSPVFRLEFDMVSRILNQDPKLYSNIEIENKEVAKAINTYIHSSKQLRNIIKKKDKLEFEKFFKNAARFIGKYKEEATKESDYLIEKMAARK